MTCKVGLSINCMTLMSYRIYALCSVLSYVVTSITVYGYRVFLEAHASLGPGVTLSQSVSQSPSQSVGVLTNSLFTVNLEVLMNLGVCQMVCKDMQSHAKSCKDLQSHAKSCNVMQCHAMSCNVMQSHTNLLLLICKSK